MPKTGMEPLRRRELIGAAIESIHAQGMAQVTMGDIARRAGVSAGLAHHYFGGKDQLLSATMRARTSPAWLRMFIISLPPLSSVAMHSLLPVSVTVAAS